jgi:hypothetical protein
LRRRAAFVGGFPRARIHSIERATASHGGIRANPVPVGWRAREDIEVDLAPSSSIRQGKRETIYEKLALDLLGISKLKEIHEEPA